MGLPNLTKDEGDNRDMPPASAPDGRVAFSMGGSVGFREWETFKPGFYRMRNGGKAEVITHVGGWLMGLANGSHFQWQTDGRVYTEGASGLDLIEPWREI